MSHIETDLSYIICAETNNAPYAERTSYYFEKYNSTNTSIFVKDFIEQNKGYILGQDFYMSFLPERMAEGKVLRS